MVESTAAQADKVVDPVDAASAISEDNLTNLQVKLNELGEMFYTYLGIVQRDAPPRSSSSAKKPEVAASIASIPEYAQDIVATSREIDTIIDAVEKDFSATNTLDGEIRAANSESKKAGEELVMAKNVANNLLAEVRLVTAMRDDDESTK